MSTTSKPFRGLGWRCLSVRQPWAWALVNGFKPLENRDYMPNYRGPLVIHAGKTLGCIRGGFEFECYEVAVLAGLGGLLPDCSNEAGGLVGMVQLTGTVTSSSSPWFSGPIGWCVERAEAWPFVPWKGRQGIWTLTVEEEHTICVQLEGCGRI